MVNIVIPAKGTSERIPRKNLVSFRGKPLLQWSIEYAFSEGYKPTVISDDAEIISLAESLSADTMIEPDYLLELHAFDVTKFAASKIKTNIVCLQATSPIRSVGLIHKAVELLESHECVYAGMPLPGHFTRDKRGALVNRKYNIDGSPPHSQQLIDEPQWVQSGTIFAYQYPTILNRNDSVYGNPGVIEIDMSEMLDIDYWSDIEQYENQAG